MDFNTQYLIHLADTAQIQSHRLQETVGKAPELEIEMALCNIGLDLLGQCRFLYQRIANELNSTEDTVALGRDSWDMKNLLLTEVPNENFAQIVAKNFFLTHFTYLLYQQLRHSSDIQIQAFATKSVKELAYHIEYFDNWIIRLGDGTDFSHDLMQNAIRECWDYIGEFFTPVEYEEKLDANIFPLHLEDISNAFFAKIEKVIEDATLEKPEGKWSQQGGKTGKHSEHLGYILAETRYMQLTYPDMKW